VVSGWLSIIESKTNKYNHQGSSITNDSRPLDLSDKYKVDGGRLVISQVYPGDEGVYTCLAQNAIGRAQAHAQLTVFKKPAIDPINHVEAAEGETVHIDCVFNGDGEIRAYWMFKGRSLDGMDDVVEEVSEWESSNASLHAAATHDRHAHRKYIDVDHSRCNRNRSGHLQL
jgi:hypothetical protein